MKKINITAGTKGGIGKTFLAQILAQTAAYRGINFEYIEIDSSNNSISSLENSEVFKNRMTSVTLDKAEEEIIKATFKALKENKIVFIDLGGGLDTIEIISIIKENFSHLEINYLLPFENNYKMMRNLVDTFDFIDDEKNTFLIKNKVLKMKNGIDPYTFFEGDKLKGIESIREVINSKNKVFEVFLSENLQYADITKESTLDLAAVAMGQTPEVAEKEFMEEDINEYLKLTQRYLKSKAALSEIKYLSEEFDELFND